MSIPWKTKLLISAYTRIRDVAFRPNITVNRRLLSLLDFKTPPSSSSSDHHIDHSRDLWFRLHTPSSSTADNLPVLIYFHGGGFVTNSADSSFVDSFSKRVANYLPSVVVAVNYRLAPEHRFPAQYDDGFDAVKFLDSAKSRNILPPDADLKRCFIIGDSAGGNLGHHIVTRANSCELERIRLRGLISLQPFFGGEERTKSELRIGNGALGLTVDKADWYWKAFLPIGSDRDHPPANVFGPNSIKI